MTKQMTILAQADTSAIRQQTWEGRDYLVVPVVMMVQGVYRSANGTQPELGLAEEFGKFSAAWNGRPVVMNHPKSGTAFVSANDPDVLSEYQIGMIFNANLQGEKLKADAFLDIERINNMEGEIGDEARNTLERINAGKVVEVSTGLFTEVEQVQGVYNGEKYSAIWRGPQSDHLALLSDGIIGACSIADGCGTPRLNNIKQDSLLGGMRVLCSDCGGTCDDNTNGPVNLSPQEKAEKPDEKTVKILRAHAENRAQAAPRDMLGSTVSALLVRALKEKLDGDENEYYLGMYDFDRDKVYYESYNNGSFRFMGRTYRITGNETPRISLGDEPFEVVFTRKVIAADDISINSNPAKEDAMSNDANTPQADAKPNEAAEADAKPEATATPEATANEQGAADAVIPANPEAKPAANASAEPAPAPKTLAEYVADMPPEVQEVMNAGLKMQADRRALLSKHILNAEGNLFTEQDLSKMGLDQLEKIASVSGFSATRPAAVSDYAAAAGNVAANSANETRFVPVPKVFEIGTGLPADNQGQEKAAS